MGFINERISKEDRIEYGLDELENSVPIGVWHPERNWTIDKERKIYLRQVRKSNSGPEAERSPKTIDTKYLFFINNIVYLVIIEDNLEKKIRINKDDEGFLKSILTVKLIKPLHGDDNNNDSLIKLLYEALLVRKESIISSDWVKKYDLTLIYKNLEIKNV